MAFCTKCGAQLADGSTFCTFCGSPQTSAQSAQVNPYSVGANYSGGYSGGYVDPNAPIIPGFSEAVSICFRKYASFQGRASRSEYWYWTLFTFLLNFVIGILLGLVAATTYSSEASQDAQAPLMMLAQGVRLISTLVLFLPTVSVFVRRLHDTNHSGWLWWLPFITGVGGALLSGLIAGATPSPESRTIVLSIFVVAMIVVCLYMLILMVRRGDDGPNKYGPAPVRR